MPFNYCRDYYEYCNEKEFELVIITYVNKMIKT